MPATDENTGEQVHKPPKQTVENDTRRKQRIEALNEQLSPNSYGGSGGGKKRKLVEDSPSPPDICTPLPTLPTLTDHGIYDPDAELYIYAATPEFAQSQSKKQRSVSPTTALLDSIQVDSTPVRAAIALLDLPTSQATPSSTPTGRKLQAFSDALECPSQTSSSQSTPMSSQSLGKLMEEFIHKLSQTPSQ